MNACIIADKTESLHGLNLEDILLYLNSLPDFAVSVPESIKEKIDCSSCVNVNFVHDIMSVNYDVYILYGINDLHLSIGHGNNVCYVPDPDFTSSFDRLSKNVESLVNNFKMKYPSGSYFSLIGHELNFIFDFFKPNQDQFNDYVFDLCIIVDDSYIEFFKEIDPGNINALIIYVGNDNEMCETAIQKLRLVNPNLGFSTFQEPISFMHTRLAKEINIVCKKLAPEIANKLLSDIRFHPNGAEGVKSYFGSISVCKFKTYGQFDIELLVNTDFKSIEGWNLASEAEYDPQEGIVSVSVAASASQAVTVSPGCRYQNSVVARCLTEQTLGRVQINWMDTKGQFVNAEIKIFECSSNWSEHVMEVTAPQGASTAVVYTAGHTSIPIQFKSNSLLR